MLRLALLVALVAACKKEDRGPACPQVVDHMLEITKQQLSGHGDSPLGDRKQMIDQCEQRKMSPGVRKCLMAAKTLAALGECRGGTKKPAEPSPAPPTGSAPSGSGAPPAPAGSGG